MPGKNDRNTYDDRDDDREANLPAVVEDKQGEAGKQDAKPETHEERSERRAKELAVHLDTHRDIIKQAHEMYPTRHVTRRLGWPDLTPLEQERWNEKQKMIDEANRAYYERVRASCAAHAEEDERLVRKDEDGNEVPEGTHRMVGRMAARAVEEQVRGSRR